ncbi:hypothetical protein [Helicobacter didelphidarum]|nr:hypothetical protein [Helicobacter didelphidarum]
MINLCAGFEVGTGYDLNNFISGAGGGSKLQDYNGNNVISLGAQHLRTA